MTTTTATGTCLSVSAATPATHDEVGFYALTWTDVGELESLGELVAEQAAAAFTNLSVGKGRIVKGAESWQPFDVGLGLDRDDTGQALLSTARQSGAARVGIRIVEPTGDAIYLQSQVLAEKVAGGDGPNDVRKGRYTLSVYMPTAAGAETPAVISPAFAATPPAGAAMLAVGGYFVRLDGHPIIFN